MRKWFCRLFLFAAVALLAVSAAAKKRKIQSPKAAEISSTSGSTMVKTSLLSAFAIVPPPQTNRIFSRTFSWGFPQDKLSQVKNFRLYYSTDPDNFTSFEDTIGTNLIYQFRRTNWSESKLRHWFVMTAVENTPEELETLPSDPAHTPLFPPDHFRLSWSNSWPQVRILSSPDALRPISQWTLLASLTNANKYEDFIGYDTAVHVFLLDKPDTLTISLFNPNP